MSIILGVDPGSRVTGYGVIKKQGRHIQYLGSGCIRTISSMSKKSAGGSTPLPERLRIIYAGLQEVIIQFQPDEFAIEQVFMSINPDAAIKLGQARGVAIVAAVNNGLPVFEYAARQIKLAVVGTGAAKKEQVQHMVTDILKLSATPQSDAADALAIAICHHHTNNTLINMLGQAQLHGHGRYK